MIKINKDKWNSTDIGSVADEINEKILNPSESGCEKFIRPEDLEIGELYVKSFREPEDVGSGKHCSIGDILFARRSVSVSQFKRRSSILKFDGVCSDEITVIRQNNHKLYPEFLNLILNTTNLWDFAIARSVGSVSKRIKWEDLATYTFKYPKAIDEQKQIVVLFQNIESSLEQVDEQEKNINNLKKRLINDLAIHENQNNNSWRTLNKSKWQKVRYGDYVDHIEKNERNVEKRKIAKYVSVENIITGKLKIQSYMQEEMPTFSRTFKTGDILFAKRRAYQRKVAIANFDGICSPHIWSLQSKTGLMQEFLAYIMLSDTFYDYANANSAGTMSVYLKWPQLSNYKMLLPSLDDQVKILDIFRNIESLLDNIELQKRTLKNLKQKLINVILG